MTNAHRAGQQSFRRYLILSFSLHIALIAVLAASGTLSRPAKKGMIHYVNFIGLPGGGGGGGSGHGGGGAISETASVKTTPAPPPVKKESLRDLTVSEKARPESASSLRYPDEKAKKSKTTPKKAAISKPEPQSAQTESSQKSGSGASPAVSGAGFGLRFGTGSGGGSGTGTGGGSGFGTGEPFGIDSFPFTYYLQIISDKISTNWFTSLIDPGMAGQFQTQVYFRIYRDGQISDLRVEVSSSLQAFDLAAIRAVQSSAPFPSLPAEYNGQYLGIHLIFEHVK